MPRGIITCVNNLFYQVKVEEKTYNCLARGKFKKDKISPVVGDKVEITITNEQNGEGVLEAILPRTNELKRPKMANLTQIIFVVSMKMPEPDLLLLDKQLAFAEYIGVNSIICFNKIDLVDKETVENLSKIYKNIGYTVIETNAKEDEILKKIEPFLKNQITAFAGNSGVGKSTIINNIFGTKISEEGNISTKNKKGKNTTTKVTLYELNNNSYLADTPGFATFDLYNISSDELAKYFIEFLEYLPNCKFIGCSHIKEESCAVKAAVEEGKIANSRYQNYKKIYEDLKEMEKNKW